MTESSSLVASPSSPANSSKEQDTERMNVSSSQQKRSPSAASSVRSGRPISRSPSPSVHEDKESIAERQDGFPLRVESLTRNVTLDHLREIFGKFGIVTNVQLLSEGNAIALKGVGVVEYATKEDADNGLQHMHGGWLDGKKIQVFHTTKEWIQRQQEKKSPSPNREPVKPKMEPRRRSPISRPQRRNSPFSPRRSSRSPGRGRGSAVHKPAFNRSARPISRSPRRRRSNSRSNNRRRYASPFRPRKRKHSPSRSNMRDREARFPRGRGRSKSPSHKERGKRHSHRRSKRSISSSSGSFVSSRSSSSRSSSASRSRSKSRSRGRARSMSRSSRSHS